MGSPVPVFHGRVEGGRLALDPTEADQRQTYLRGLEGKAVEVIVRPPRRKRSLDQNAFAWGVVYPVLAEHLGYDTHEHEMLHYALLGECFGTSYDQRFGRDIPRVSSSRMTVREFADYLDWVIRWAATEHGVVIPKRYRLISVYGKHSSVHQGPAQRRLRDQRRPPLPRRVARQGPRSRQSPAHRGRRRHLVRSRRPSDD
jgi:hypothetical protein